MSVLVVTEKPSVAMSIAKVLGAEKRENGFLSGNGYIVSWCVGHLIELAKPEAYDAHLAKWRMQDLPILPDCWKMEIIQRTKAQFQTLKKLMHRKDVAMVVNGCDAGREGELIFRNVYNMAGCVKPMKRLWISSMEDSAIREGFKHLKDAAEFDGLYEAARCRNQADWLVGINLSRLVSLKNGKTLNVGRVISPTLEMVMQKEQSIKAFEPVPFYQVVLRCGMVAETERLESKADAEKIAGQCEGKQAEVICLKRKLKVENPPKLYDLTTLQREANRLFGYTAQQCLDIVQSLYEKKLVTYPRTDSRYLTHDSLRMLPELAASVENALPFTQSLNLPINEKQVIDDAKVTDHHAIIPTQTMTKANLDDLPTGEQKLLKLIAVRLLEAVGKPYCYEETKVTLDCEGTKFSAKGKTVNQTGWKIPEAAFRGAMQMKNTPEPYQRIPQYLAEGQTLEVVGADVREGTTTPPKRYTEDTLLAAMEAAGEKEIPKEAERKGIGTPATRAGILEKLVKAGLVERQGKGMHKEFVPTEKGRFLDHVLPEDIRSADMTAIWERGLLAVERGEKSPEQFMAAISEFVAEQVRGKR